MIAPSYLLDTNVLAELRKPHPAPQVVEFVAGLDPGEIFISVLSLGEIGNGIAVKRQRRGEEDSLLRLEHWLTELRILFADRILPIDLDIADLWGKLSADRPRPVVDTLLAATALHHGLTLVTRNVKDVSGTGVIAIDPWL